MFSTSQIGGLAISAGPSSLFGGGFQGPAEIALTLPRQDLDTRSIKRAKDLIGKGPGNFSVPLSTREIKSALTEVRFLIERLPLIAQEQRYPITADQLVHIAVVYALADALVHNSTVEVVNQ